MPLQHGPAAAGDDDGHIQFQHTQLGAYLVGFCALLYMLGERGQVRARTNGDTTRHARRSSRARSDAAVAGNGGDAAARCTTHTAHTEGRSTSQRATTAHPYIQYIHIQRTTTYIYTQEIVLKYHLHKRWYYLYGALCLAAYLYALPSIRRGLGSARRGYVNLSTAYICWLMLAVFYHLPSLETLGIDVRADLSLLLSVACYSLAVSFAFQKEVEVFAGGGVWGRGQL